MTGILCCDFGWVIGTFWGGFGCIFPGQQIRLLTAVKLGTCETCRREARQDLPGVTVQGSSTCPTKTLQREGDPLEHKSSS